MSEEKCDSRANKGVLGALLGVLIPIALLATTLPGVLIADRFVGVPWADGVPARKRGCCCRCRLGVVLTSSCIFTSPSSEDGKSIGGEDIVLFSRCLVEKVEGTGERGGRLRRERAVAAN